MTAGPGRGPGPETTAGGRPRRAGQAVADPAGPQHPGQLLAATRDILFEVDPVGTITWLRDSGSVLADFSLIGRRVDQLFSPADSAALMACMQRAEPDGEMSGQAPAPRPGDPAGCDPYPARLAREGGHTHHLEVVLRPVLDPDTGALMGGAGSIRDVTSAAAMLADLQAERRRTAAMFAGHDAIMLLVDPADGSVVDANEAACRFYGYRRTELAGRHITDLNLLPIAEVRERMAQATAGSRNAFVFPHRLADGTVRQVEVHSSPIVDETGRTVLFSIVRDVTDELVAAAERDLMTTRYHRLASMASDVVAEGDNDGLLRWISESVSRVLGFPAEALVGRPFLDLVHPDDQLAAAAAQAQVLAGGEATFQVRLETRAGGYRWMSIQLRPVRDEGGAVVGRVAGWRDITEAEQIRADIEEREALLSQVLDGTTDAVMLTRPGRPLWISASFTQTFGWRPEDLFADPLVMIPAEGRAAYRAAWDEIRARRLTRADQRVEVACADGTRRWVDSRSRIVWTPDSRLLRIVSSLRDITDQVALERDVRDSRARYRMLAEHSSDVVLAVTLDGVVSWASPSTTALLEWQPSQLVGRPAGELLHPDDRPLLAGAGRPLPGGIRAIEVRVRRAGGGMRWMSATAADLATDDGQVIGATISLQDAEQRVADRRAIEELAEQYRNLAESASDVVYRTDDRGTVDWISPSVTRTLGWPVEHVLGLPARELLHPEDLALVRHARDEALARGADLHQRVRLRTADGTYRWMRASSRPVRRDGQLAAWLTALQDIDDEVRAEQALRDSEALLKASLERLLDPHVYAVAVRDSGGDVVDFRHVLANDAACRYLRMDRADVVGRTVRELLRGPAVDTLVEWLRTALAAGALLVDAQPMFSTTQGGQRLFDIRAAKVGDGVTFTWRDVTERYR